MSVTVQELVAKFGLSVGQDGFKKADRHIATLKQSAQSALGGVTVDSGSIQDGVSALGSLKGALMGIGAVAAAVGAIKLFRGLVDDTAAAIGQLKKTSSQIGLSVQEIQGWEHAAKRSGASAEDFSGAAKALGSQMQALSMGSKGAAMGLGRLKMGSIAGKDLNQVFEMAAEAIAKMPDGIKKTAAVTATFGEAGASLIPMFNRGAAGIRELRKEVEIFGAQLSNEDIQAATDYKAELARLGLVAQGLRQSVAGPLMRAWGDLNKQFTDWVRQQGKDPTKKVRAGFEQLYFVQQKGLAVMKMFFEALVFVGSKIELFFILAGAMAAATLAATGFGVASLFAFAKFLLLTALIATFILIMNSLYRAITGQSSVLETLFNKGMQYLEIWTKDPGDSWILKQLNEIAKFWNEEGGLRKGIRAFVQEARDLFEGLALWFEERWAPIKEFFGKVADVAGKVAGAGKVVVGAAARGAQAVDDFMTGGRFNQPVATRSATAPTVPTTADGRPAQTGGNMLSGLFRPKIEIKVEGVSDPVAAAQAMKRKLDAELATLDGNLSGDLGAVGP